MNVNQESEVCGVVARRQAKDLRIGDRFLNANGDTVFEIIPDWKGKIAIKSVRGKQHHSSGLGFARIIPSRWVNVVEHDFIPASS